MLTVQLPDEVTGYHTLLRQLRERLADIAEATRHVVDWKECQGREGTEQRLDVGHLVQRQETPFLDVCERSF